MAPAPMDDPVLASCKWKLSHFRVKELKDVLHQLGLPKLGNKKKLLDRLTSVLCDQQDQDMKLNGREKVVQIVEDTFVKMQDSSNTVAASRSHIDYGQNAKPKKKPHDSPKLDAICCPCGNSMPTDSMIKCVDPQCNVWQHVNCVITPENPADNSAPELPSSFYCEMCRISRADPFRVTVNHPLLPILITPSIIAADGSYTIQYTAKSFALSRANREMLQKAEYDLQVWCILLNDKVPFRMHWPLHSDMRVNGVHVRVVNRRPTQKLGANGRDDGPVLTDYLREGSNKFVLSRNDTRTFCLGIRIVKRRTLEQVLNLVPMEQDGEKFDDALARVRRCVGGGTEANNGGSDSDIEVVADSVSVNVRCPMTASRIRVAGRFKPCAHMGCFDLEAFIEINQRSRKWQCPICLKNYSLENIIIDPYFNRITSLIQRCGDKTTEIDVKADGSWRVKGGTELKELAQWHLPDGTLCTATDSGPTANTDNIVIEELLSGEPSCRLKLGIRNISNSQWEGLVSSSDGDRARRFEGKSCATRTSTIDDVDTEDESCSLEPGRNDFPMSHVQDLESSASENVAPSSRGQDVIVPSVSDAGENVPPSREQDVIVPSDSDAGENVPPSREQDVIVSSDSDASENALSSSREQDVIVLSDSDDDDIVTVSSPKAVNCSSIPDLLETSGVGGEQPGGGPNGSTYLSLKEKGFDDLGLSFRDVPWSPRDDPDCQMFDPSTQVTMNPEEVENYPASDQSKHEPAASVGDLGSMGVAGNRLENGHDGVLQACTSSKRDGGIGSANLCEHPQTCHDRHSDYCNESLVDAKTTSRKRRNSEGGITALDASVGGSTACDGLHGERCLGPLSPPQKRCSVQPILTLTIDSDADSDIEIIAG